MLHEYPQLFVSWRSPKSRRVHPVGRLTNDPATHGYEFRYVRNVSEATTDGFVPFSEFPTLAGVYRAHNLFPLFANRVMPKSRPDYRPFLNALGLSPETADPMVILARTGGTRQTDQIELFPVPKPDPDGCYFSYCLLRAVKYMPGPVVEERLARLQPGERLLMFDDWQNPVDGSAVGVRTEDSYMVGYLPAYLTADIRALRDKCGRVEVLVERFNPPPAEVHHRLLCKVVSCWPEGFEPFAGERFQPVPASPNGAA